MHGFIALSWILQAVKCQAISSPRYVTMNPVSRYNIGVMFSNIIAGILLLYIKLVMVKLYIHLAILGNTLYLLSLFEPIINLFTNWKDNFVPSCLKSIKVLDVPR